MSSDIGATWSGSHRFGAERLIEAETIEQVQDAVAGIAAAGGRVRALGTRHSFNDLADTSGTLLTVTGIPAEPELSDDGTSVWIGGGVRYGVLAAWLEEHGRALHNMGSLPHISVAGATATGTHGSGLRNGSLSTAVRGIRYVNHVGELVEARRGDPGFDGLVVGLGAYGVVVRVELDVQPSFRMRQDVYRDLPWAAALDDLDGVLGFGYSVSLFDDWQGETIDQVWVKSRIDELTGDSAVELPSEWRGAQRDPRSEGRLIDLASENLNVQGGVEGAWLDRLPHFRLDSTPSIGNELQTEYFVARSDGAAALAAVRELRDRITPHLLVTEVRTIAASPLWLDPAYERDSLAIHFTWKFEPDAVAGLLPDIEAALYPFDPRPHWGKINHIDADAIGTAYHRLPEARAQFELLDPDDRFTNAYLQRLRVRDAR